MILSPSGSQEVLTPLISMGWRWNTQLLLVLCTSVISCGFPSTHILVNSPVVNKPSSNYTVWRVPSVSCWNPDDTKAQSTHTSGGCRAGLHPLPCILGWEMHPKSSSSHAPLCGPFLECDFGCDPFQGSILLKWRLWYMGMGRDKHGGHRLTPLKLSVNSLQAPPWPDVNKVREGSPILPSYIWSPDLLCPNALF